MLLQLLTASWGNASIFQLQTCANYFRSASGSLQRFHDLILMVCTKRLQSDLQFYSCITVCAYKLVMIQLDNVARTVLCNNVADCHISLHWDGDGLGYDKGCFYISVPDGLKSMEPVASHWQEHDALGASLVEGLRTEGMTIYQNGSMNIDLTQTSYSTIPSVDMELGNASSDHSDSTLNSLADGLVLGLNAYFGN